MAYPRKYYSYRGRRNRTKTVLAVVLVLVILASIVVILLQRNMVYDETGTPYLELPWQKEPRPEEEKALGDVELTIQAPVLPQLNAFLLPEGPLTHKRWEEARQDAPCGTAVLTLKGERVWFGSEAALPRNVSSEEDTALLLETVTSDGTHAVARMSCFRDPEAAESDESGMALEDIDGYVFYDGSNSRWLDPAKPAARQYLCELACEIASLGFDELLLTDVSYPTEGRLDDIACDAAAKEAHLLTFLRELRAALDPYAVVLSVEVPADLVAEGRNDAAGLTLTGLTGAVDRIYAPTAPERMEAFAAAVNAAGADFVPVLTAEEPLPDAGSWLLIP